MKAFIDRVFKSKQKKQKELLDEIANTEVTEQVTEAAVEAIIEENKKIITRQIEQTLKEHTDTKDD
jgi:uncharacterized membrane-anchored protein YjiN (DUF445 family)